MEDIDAQIGKNVARLRGDMSQKELADKMRAFGHKWSQSTVWSIERGDRSVKLSEAEHLSRILRTGVKGIKAFVEADGDSQIDAASWRIKEQYEQMRADVAAYFDLQVQLAMLADSFDELSGHSHFSIRSWVDLQPEQIVKEVRQQQTAEGELQRKELGIPVDAEDPNNGPYASMVSRNWKDYGEQEHQEAP